MKKLFLLDMDGTIYLGEQLFEGTAEFLSFVKERGGQYAFLSNNSSRGIEGYLAKMQRMGIPQTPWDFLTSVDSTIEYLKKTYPGCDKNVGEPGILGCDCFSVARRKTVFYVCGTENLKGQLRAAGLSVLSDDEAEMLLAAQSGRHRRDGSSGAKLIDSARESAVNADSCAAASLPVVLLGFDTELYYRKLEICVRLLGCGADYIATHPDLTCPVEWGNMPDIGLVIHDLEVCTGRKPVIIGKPQPQMVYSALKKYGAKPEDAVLIGDRLYTDIACGENAGIDTILVLSGEGTAEDCEKYGVHPTWIYKDIAAVLEDMKAGKI